MVDTVQSWEMVETEESWVTEARDQQQQFLETLGLRLYDSYRKRIPSICNLLLSGYCKCLEGDDGLCNNESEIKMLRRKIGYALLGNPTEELKEENEFTGYPIKNLKAINKVYNQILGTQNGDKVVLMSILFVYLKIDDRVSITPVFRICKGELGNVNECQFVDCEGRLYKSWNDFLSTNNLPKAKWCYPKDGFYSGDSLGKVELCFGATPASSRSALALNTLDKVTTVATIGSLAYPPAAVVVGGLAAVYGFIRGSLQLHDRRIHRQSLNDRGAYRVYFSMAASSLGLASSAGVAMVRAAAAEGKVVSDLARGCVNVLNGSALVANGVATAEGVISYVENGEWNVVEGVQVIAQTAFLFHAAINFKTARSLICETQTQILESENANLSRRQRKLFAGMQKETLKGEDLVIGRAKIIKDLNHVSNKQEFFSQIFRQNKTARKNSTPVKKVKFGSLVTPHDVSSQGFHSRPTVGQFGNFVHSTQLQYGNSRDSTFFNTIRGSLNNIVGNIDTNALLLILERTCKQFRHGEKVSRVIRILMDILHCHRIDDGLVILRDVIAFIQELWEEFQGEQENGNLNEEEMMSRIIGDPDFTSSCILNLLNTDEEGDVYHFPVDHCTWGENGELESEEYISIAENALGISNVERANIEHGVNTATVYFEHVGLVIITSFVQDQLIVVKKFVNDEMMSM